MFCSSCGKQINDGVKFCKFCGAAQVIDNQTIVNEPPPIPTAQKQTLKEGQIHKCPYCGEILPFDAIACPSCGREIRNKKSLESISDLVNKIQAEPDEEKKIELIKLYPIPNSREDIFEFMVVATSKFDAAFYANNPTANSIAGAWYTQIDLCYKKGQMMFTDPGDRARLDQLYNAVMGPEGSLTKEKKKRKIILLIGVGGIALGAILLIVSYAMGAGNRAAGVRNGAIDGLMLFSIALIPAGIVVLAKGLKKKMTAKEMEIAKEQQAAKAQAKKEAIERKDRLQREAAERSARR